MNHAIFLCFRFLNDISPRPKPSSGAHGYPPAACLDLSHLELTQTIIPGLTTNTCHLAPLRKSCVLEQHDYHWISKHINLTGADFSDLGSWGTCFLRFGNILHDFPTIRTRGILVQRYLKNIEQNKYPTPARTMVWVGYVVVLYVNIPSSMWISVNFREFPLIEVH